MESRTIIIVISVLALILALVLWTIYRIRRGIKNPFDDMDGVEFENFCARLLESVGFIDVEVTKGSHDYGVDIFASKDGITYAFQCKCYSDSVGIKAVQEIYAGRDFYGRMVGVVMTNQFFTKPAVEVAEKLNILLWDGDFITDMISGYSLNDIQKEYFQAKENNLE